MINNKAPTQASEWWDQGNGQLFFNQNWNGKIYHVISKNPRNFLITEGVENVNSRDRNAEPDEAVLYFQQNRRFDIYGLPDQK